MRALRVALLTHSINPRGGVVHVLELGRALQARGHDVTLIAPAAPGQRFFRDTPCRVALAPMPSTVGLPVRDTVRARIDAMHRHLGALLVRQPFDVFHAHDGIGANALADLRAQGRLAAYLRTVHHVDRFADAHLQAWEERSIAEASVVLGVSALWCEALRRQHPGAVVQVPNGVDLERFSPGAQANDAEVARRLGLGAGPVVLQVGGIEARKNTRRLLQAFVQLKAGQPQAQLVIAGGASLLDHRDEAAAFRLEAAQAGLQVAGPGDRGDASADVRITGPLADADMPALYRRAEVVAMPSLLEGFGLAALEGLASGTPAVVSRLAPFTEHFGDEVDWADPYQPASIAEALKRALARGRHAEAPAVCRRFGWDASAARHEAVYRAAQALRLRAGTPACVARAA